MLAAMHYETHSNAFILIYQTFTVLDGKNASYINKGGKRMAAPRTKVFASEYKWNPGEKQSEKRIVHSKTISTKFYLLSDVYENYFVPSCI